MSIVLETQNMDRYFGGLAAVKDVDITIKEQEIIGLIGPNGAGKTTLFNCISGVFRPTRGTIRFRGQEITGLKPHKICRLGIGRTHQITIPFLGMTVLENVLVGATFGHSKAIENDIIREEAERLLDFVGLAARKATKASSLNLHDRKALDVARALATQPQLLLLDEVAAGLNPTETTTMMELIQKIRNDLGITVFWIEHVMKAVMGVTERIVVLHHGEKIAEGTPQEIANDSKVIDAYLGERYII